MRGGAAMLPVKDVMAAGDKVIAVTGSGGKTTLARRLARQLAGWGRKVLLTSTERTAAPSRNLVLLDTCKRIPPYTLLTVGRGIDPATGGLSAIAPGDIPGVAQRFGADVVVVEAGASTGRPLDAPHAQGPGLPESADLVIAMAGLDALGRPVDARSVSDPEAFCRITGLSPGALIELATFKLLARHPLGLFRGCPQGARRLAFFNKAETWAPASLDALVAAMAGLEHPWVAGSAAQGWYWPQ